MNREAAHERLAPVGIAEAQQMLLNPVILHADRSGLTIADALILLKG